MGDRLERAIKPPEAFTLLMSPLLRVDGTKPDWQRYSINVYFHHGEPHDIENIVDSKLYCTVFGPTETVTRMRAEIICRGVNKMRPPTVEYPSVGFYS